MTTFTRCEEHDMSYPANGVCPKCSPGTQDRASAGDDGRARLEKDLGLDIDPKTGRAYESQGDFHNLGLGTGGRFYNGAAVPRTARCHNCEGFVTEAFWGQGFENCGGVDIGGQWFLCPECIKKVLAVLPRVRALVAAHNGGDLKRRG